VRDFRVVRVEDGSFFVVKIVLRWDMDWNIITVSFG
jgi:hypothetical protein